MIKGGTGTQGVCPLAKLEKLESTAGPDGGGNKS